MKTAPQKHMQRTQIKINLSVKLKKYLVERANEMSVTIAGYLKYLIIKDKSETAKIPPRRLGEPVEEFYTEPLD